MEIIEYLKEYWTIISFLFYVVSGYIIWKLSAQFVTRDEYKTTIEKVNTLDKAIDDIEKHMSSIENKLTSLPDGGAINNILLGIEELRGQQNTLREVFDVKTKAQEQTMERMEKTLDMLVHGHLGENK